jgi:tRNA (mo5U34)-methyltransferase
MIISGFAFQKHERGIKRSSQRDGGYFMCDCKFSKAEVLAKVEKVPYWGQSIPLPYGIVTPGKLMRNFNTWKRMNMQGDLSGKRVLDIACWDGFYAFECEKRGAEVVAIDNLNRMKSPDQVEHAWMENLGFETAREILDSKVQFYDLDVYDISSERIGSFDIVLCLGLLYHLKHPVLALERISEVTREQLIIETEYLTVPFTKRPLLEYIERDSLNRDPTNFCRPNISWIQAVLRELGFKKIEIIYKPSTIKIMAKGLLRMSFRVNRRAIFKAWK